MYQLELLIGAFGDLFTHGTAILAIVLGSLVGLILGATPGLTSTVGMVLLVPFTFYMDTLTGIVVLYAIHKAGSYGGSIPAILMNTPGTPAAACTQLDGYPLTQQGKQGLALKTAATASALGDLASDLVLIFCTVYVADVVYQFGPVELAGILFFALTLIGSISGHSVAKGLFATCLGLFFGTVGLDPIEMTPRFTFGLPELAKTMDIIPVMVGAFVASEVFIQTEKRAAASGGSHAMAEVSTNPEENKFTWKTLRRISPSLGISYAIGQLIGVIPGIGGAVSPWIAYGQVKSLCKNTQSFGKGDIRGVAAAEAANNAVCGANLMPMLTLGVPGSTDAVIIMGAFLIHGMEMGPRIFLDQAPLVYALFASGIITIAIYWAIGFFLAQKVGRMIVSFPAQVVYPVVLVVCFIGSYATNTSIFDVGIMVFFGIVGYCMRKTGIPVAPMIIAYILAFKLENSVRQALIMSTSTGDGMWIFFSHKICLFFILLAFVTVTFTLWRNNGKKKRGT